MASIFDKYRRPDPQPSGTPMGYAIRPEVGALRTPFNTVGPATPFYTVDPEDARRGTPGREAVTGAPSGNMAYVPANFRSTGEFQRTSGRGRGAVLGVGVSELAGALVSITETMFPDSEFLQEARRSIEEAVERQIESLSPQRQRELEKQFLTAQTDQSVLLDPSAFITQFVRQIPNFAFSLAPAGGAAAFATRTAAARGASAAAQSRAGAIAGGAAGGAAAGPMIAGYTAGEIASGIEQADVETLRENPVFAQMEQEMGESAARRALIEELRGPAALQSGTISAALGIGGGAFLSRLFAPTGVQTRTVRRGGQDVTQQFTGRSRTRSAGEQFLAQGITEAPQEASEAIIGNLAAQRSFDPRRGTFEGAAEGAAAGFAFGGTTGGLVGGAAGGRRNVTEVPPPGQSDVDPGVRQALSVGRGGQGTLPGFEIGEASQVPGLPEARDPMSRNPLDRAEEDAAVEAQRQRGLAGLEQGGELDLSLTGTGASFQRLLGLEALALPAPGQTIIPMGEGLPGDADGLTLRRGPRPIAEDQPGTGERPQRRVAQRDPRVTQALEENAQGDLDLGGNLLPSPPGTRVERDPVQQELFERMLAGADDVRQLRETLQGLQRRNIAEMLESVEGERMPRSATKSAMIDHIENRYGGLVGQDFADRMEAGRQRQLDLRTPQERIQEPTRGEIRPDADAARSRLRGTDTLTRRGRRPTKSPGAVSNDRRISARSQIYDAQESRGAQAKLNTALDNSPSFLVNPDARSILQDFGQTVLRAMEGITPRARRAAAQTSVEAIPTTPDGTPVGRGRPTTPEANDAVRRWQDLAETINNMVNARAKPPSSLGRDILRNLLLADSLLQDAGATSQNLVDRFTDIRSENDLLRAMAETIEELAPTAAREQPRRQPTTVESQVRALDEAAIRDNKNAPPGGWKAALRDLQKLAGLRTEAKVKVEADGKTKWKSPNNLDRYNALMEWVEGQEQERLATRTPTQRAEDVAAEAERRQEQAERDAQERAQAAKTQDAQHERKKQRDAAGRERAKGLVKASETDMEQQVSFYLPIVKKDTTQKGFVKHLLRRYKSLRAILNLASDPTLDIDVAAMQEGLTEKQQGSRAFREKLAVAIFKSNAVQRAVLQVRQERQKAKKGVTERAEPKAAPKTEKERLAEADQRLAELTQEADALLRAAATNSNAFTFMTAVNNMAGRIRARRNKGRVKESPTSDAEVELTAERYETMILALEREVDKYLARVADGHFEQKAPESSGETILAQELNEEIQSVRETLVAERKLPLDVPKRPTKTARTFKSLREFSKFANKMLDFAEAWASFVTINQIDADRGRAQAQQRQVAQALESVAAPRNVEPDQILMAQEADLNPEAEWQALLEQQRADAEEGAVRTVASELAELGPIPTELTAEGRAAAEQARAQAEAEGEALLEDRRGGVARVEGELDQSVAEQVSATWDEALASPDQVGDLQWGSFDYFNSASIIQRVVERLQNYGMQLERLMLIDRYRKAEAAYRKNVTTENLQRRDAAVDAITTYNQNKKKNPYFRPIRQRAKGNLPRDPMLDPEAPFAFDETFNDLVDRYNATLEMAEPYFPGEVKQTLRPRSEKTGRLLKGKEETLETFEFNPSKKVQQPKPAASGKLKLAQIARNLFEGKTLTKAEQAFLNANEARTLFEGLSPEQRQLLQDIQARPNQKATNAQKAQLEILAAEAVDTDVAQAMRNILANEARLKKSKKGIYFDPTAIARYAEGYKRVGAKLYDALRNMPTEGADLATILRALDDTGNPFTNQLITALSRLGLDVKVKFETTTDLGQLGEYDPNTRTILLNPDLLAAIQEQGSVSNAEGTLAHVFLHEAVHAATVHGLTTNRRIARSLEQLRKQVMLQLLRKYPTKNMPYGIRNLNEFIAEAFTNPEFQKELQGFQMNRPGPIQSLWDAFTNFVRTVINRLSGGRLNYEQTRRAGNAFEQILASANDLFMSEQQVLDAMARGDQMISTDPILFADQFSQGFKLALEKGRGMSTGIMTRQQLTDWYGKYFDKAMVKWNELQAMREAWMRRYQADANDISVRWSRLNETNREAEMIMNDLLHDSRALEVAPQHSIDHKLNKHLKGNPFLEARYREARKRYETLKTKHPEARKLYDDLTKYFNEDFVATQTALVNNILDTFDVERTYTGGDLDVDAIRTRQGEELSDRSKEALKTLIRRRQQRRGNYFPSMRFGDHVLAYRTEVEFEGRTREEVEQQIAAHKLEDKTAEASPVMLGEDGVYRASIDSRVIEFFESSSEAHAKRNSVLNDPQYSKVENVSLREDLLRGQDEAPGWKFFEQLKDEFQKTEKGVAMLDSMKEVYLRMLPETSIRKHEMRRRKVKGASMDMHRTFRSYAMKASYHRSQLQYGRDIGRAVEDMKGKARDQRFGEDPFQRKMMDQVVAEIIARDQKMINMTKERPVISKVTDLGFVWYLFSPSYWMVNATQPYALGLPYLASRWEGVGVARAAGAMNQVYKEIFSDVIGAMRDSKLGIEALRTYKTQAEFFDANNLIQKYRDMGEGGIADMLQEVAERGLIDVGGFAANLRENASSSVDTFDSRWNRVIEMARTMPHIVEVMNRSVIGIAAYRLSMENNTHVEPEARQKQAVEDALKAIRDTQFDYSGGNKARYMSSNTFALAGPLFLFKQYMQHIYFTFAKGIYDLKAGNPAERWRAGKQLGFITMTHMAFAGVLGGLFEPAKWALGAIYALFQDKNDPITFDEWMRQIASDYLGPQAGEALTRGLPRALGVDVSTRINLDRLLFFGVDLRDRDGFRAAVVAALGPIAAIGERGHRGALDMAEGNILRGMENATPKLFRDWIRTARMTTEGMVDYRGNIIADTSSLSPWGLFVQSLGLGSAQVAEINEGRRSIQNRNRNINERRRQLMNEYYLASPSERVRLRNTKIRAFNESHPEAGTRIDFSTLQRSVRERERFEQQQRQDLAVVRGQRRERLVNDASYANTRLN